MFFFRKKIFLKEELKLNKTRNDKMPLINYNFLDFTKSFLENNPVYFATFGMYFSVGVSVLGAAWGILLTASSLMGSSIKTSFRSKHLISILFCEANAIYGLIACFIFLVC